MADGVVHSRVHGQEHGEEEHNHEKKSVLKKVKAKAKKIKETITKHGHDHEHEHEHDYHYDDQHIPDDHDLDEEDDKNEQDPEIHGAPIYDSAAVKSSLPRQVGNSGQSRVNVGGTTVMGQEPLNEPRVVVSSSTAEGVHHNRATDPVKTFVGEDKTGTAEIHVTPIQSSFTRMNIHDEEKPNSDQKVMATAVETQYPYGRDRDQQVLPTHYPSAGSHDQFSPEQTTKNLSTLPENRPVIVEAFGTTPKLEEETYHETTENPSNQSIYTEKISSVTSAIADKAESAKNAVASKLGHGEQGDRDNDANQMKHEEHGIGEKHPSNLSSYTEKLSSATSTATSAIADKAISANNALTSKLGYGEKGDRNEKGTTHEERKSGNSASNTGSSMNTSNTSGSTGNTTSMAESAADYGKKIASTVTEKLAPAYGAVAGAGSAVNSKVSGTGSETGAATGSPKQDKGISVKEYLADMLRPGDEDRALSEVISETLHNKKKEEPTKISDVIHKREEEPEKEKVRQRHLGKVTQSEEVKRSPGDEKVEKEIHESCVNNPGQGVVDKVKDVVGDWLSKSGENQTSQGGQTISNKSVPEGGYGVQVTEEKRLQESSN